MRAILLVLLTLGLVASVTAEAKTEVLGELKVNFRAESDVLKVGVDQGPYRKIRLEVEGNDIELFQVVVTYGSGADEVLEVRHSFKEGSRSRDIDLKGGDRFIRKITFHYKTSGKLREGRATLKVLGVVD